MSEMEIGNFRILEKLGEGGMGVVYKAVDTSLDRIVAIKVLNRDLSRVPELVARFRGEARAQANLNHTNLATLYAFLTVGENAMMVMEFVDGETFGQIIQRRGPLPAQGAVPMFRQALLGFSCAHRAGVIHRDIKPSNLMLNKQGIVKVMDFGIAKTLGERGLTRTGARVGTSRYMSPEQVLNKEADIRSDIYALGLTLYEMLTANTPFQSDSEFQIMSDHVNTAPPPPTQFYPYIPKGVENAVMKALAKNPDQRFQTVEEFGSALERPDDFGVVAPTSVVLGPTQLTQPTPQPMHYAAPGGQATPPPTATMPLAGPAFVAAPQYHTPPAGHQTVPPQYQAAPPQYHTAPPQQYQTVPPQYQTPPSRTPLRHQKYAAALATLLATWPGRIVVGGITALVLLMGGWLALRPEPPRPLPAPIAPQVAPSQVTNPAPNPERVDIELNSAAKPLLVNAFEASPNPVRPGQRVTLSWSVPGASEVSISPSIGTVPAEGSRVITAKHDQEFTLTAKSVDGQTVSRSLNLLVDASSAKPTPTPTSVPPSTVTVVTPAQPPRQPTPQAPPPQEAPPPQAPPDPAPSQPANQQQLRASPVMNLYHDHGLRPGNKQWAGCWGKMQIGNGRVAYKTLGTTDGRRDDFVVPVSAVDEVKVNLVPIRGRAAFHMRINGQNFNFVPAAGSPVMFVNVIQQWLQAK